MIQNYIEKFLISLFVHYLKNRGITEIQLQESQLLRFLQIVYQNFYFVTQELFPLYNSHCDFSRHFFSLAQLEQRRISARNVSFHLSLIISSHD